MDAAIAVAEALDGAHFVYFEAEFGLIFAWNGGHTVNIYGLDGREIDCMSVGSFADDHARLSEVREAISQWLADEDEESVNSSAVSAS